MVHVIHDTDPTDDNSKLRTFLRLHADVEKALAADIHRDDLAVDTIITGRQMRDREGQEVWAQISGRVRFHRGYGAPNG